jgi:hypothetical protein
MTVSKSEAERPKHSRYNISRDELILRGWDLSPIGADISALRTVFRQFGRAVVRTNGEKCRVSELA